MRRGEWHADARALGAQGLPVGDIARRLGVTYSAVYKVLNPEKRSEYYRRAMSKPGRLEAKRRWQREFDRSDAGRSRCKECGVLLGVASTRHGSEVCRSCITAARDARWDAIERLWHEGAKFPQIMAELGMSKGHVSSEIDRMRKAGRNVPHRYRTDGGKRAA